jgi:hypothetical protein
VSPHPKLTTLGISLGGQPVKHRQLSITIMQHQGYEINGYTFYMRAQEEKSSNQNSGAHIDAIGND